MTVDALFFGFPYVNILGYVTCLSPHLGSADRADLCGLEVLVNAVLMVEVKARQPADLLAVLLRGGEETPPPPKNETKTKHAADGDAT